jgi:nucleotide-binding universal stress UspA family protein
MATSTSRRIIVGYDGSQNAKRALQRAADFGAHSDVVVVAVAEPYPRSGVTIPANLDALEAKRRLTDLREGRARLAQAGIAARTVLARGEPAEVLVSFTADADLVIVGARTLTRLQRALLGSVSARVAAASHCDVLVAP